MSSSPAAVPATSSGEVEDWLAWGVAQRPSKKNEDRFVATSSSTAPWADFVTAVLDGHNGRRAAETCAMRLVPLVNEELARLEKSTGAPPLDDGRDDPASPNWHPQLEAALSAAFVRLDREIRAAVPDGTTAGVVLFKRAPNGGVGVKCAWVGDSRAVLARYGAGGKAEVCALSRDHKATDPMEAARIEAFYGALARLERSGSHRSESDEGSSNGERTGSGHGATQVLTDAMMASGPTKGSGSEAPISRSPSIGHTMDEEMSGTFAALTEFDPTQLGLNVSRDGAGSLVVNLPPRTPTRAGSEFSMVRSSAGTAPVEPSVKGGGGAAEKDPPDSRENSRHGPTALSDLRVRPAKPAAAAATDSKLAAAPAPATAVPALPPRAAGSKLSAAALEAAQKAAANVPARVRRSFVARLRDPETGAMSNPRLFGGNVGASTAMTRSIGDRGAARCCIAEPEFTTKMVAPGQKARVIIASDGMWDVYEDEESETISRGTMIDLARTSDAAAMLLAKRAQEDRSFDGLAPDDITVVVCDLHGGALPPPGQAGCCALM